jgi:acyl-coenzyme A synthetase/AMP-(fatty) acid ligase
MAVTNRRYAHLVERFAGSAQELGVRPGHVVGMQLPNWWQACALYLAAARVGAIIAPVITTIRRRELDPQVARAGAGVFVTIDRGEGFDHTELARSIARSCLTWPRSLSSVRLTLPVRAISTASSSKHHGRKGIPLL